MIGRCSILVEVSKKVAGKWKETEKLLQYTNCYRFAISYFY